MVSWFRFEPDQDRIHPRIWRRDGVVVQDQNAFTQESIVARGFKDFGRAVRIKLVREIAGQRHPLARQRAASQ